MSARAEHLSWGQWILDSTYRVTSILRILLMLPILVFGFVVRSADHDLTGFVVVFIGFLVWAAGSAWWSMSGPSPAAVPSWVAPVSITIDLLFFVAFALVSAGATSYITPLFYLYPVFSILYYRPALTATVGFLVAGAYAAVWLQNLAVRGGPDRPDVVWLHFLMLLWMAVTTTGLALVLSHRARVDADSRRMQDSLTAQLIATDQREAARFADFLHDGPLQEVIAVRRLLEQSEGSVQDSENVATANRLLEGTTQTLRGVVSTLHPHVLTELGLEAALRELMRQTQHQGGLQTDVTIGSLADVPEEVAFVAYAAAREFVSNVQRHAQATRVSLSVRYDDGRLLLAVVDDGVGVDESGLDRGAHIRRGHIGLASHALRIRTLGGRMDLEAQEPHGTAVLVSIPWP